MTSPGIGLTGDVGQATAGKLTRAYLLALTLIAGLIVLSGWEQHHLVNEQAGNAYVMNIAGAQRMLSQRLAAHVPDLSSLDADVSASARAKATTDLDRFERSHLHLSVGDEAPALASDELKAYYFSSSLGRESLDAQVRAFARDYRRLIEWSAHRSVGLVVEAARLREAAMLDLLPSLHQAVQLHEKAAELGVQRVLRFHMAATVGALLLLVGEALFIFVPLVRRTSAQAAQLARDGQTDALTGALNRRVFIEQLDKACTSGVPFVICLIDVDRFKSVNRHEGHAMGDALLQAIVGRLRAAARPQDWIARVGSDEFALLLWGCEDAANGQSIARRLLHTLRQPFQVHNVSRVLEFSVGMAVGGRPGLSAQSLLGLAAEALVHARQPGHEHLALADADGLDRLKRSSVLHHDLSSVRSGELPAGVSVAFQPCCWVPPVGDGGPLQVKSVEALARWNHPTLGTVSPVELLLALEREGLSVPGLRLLRQTALDGYAQAMAASALPPDTRLAVNLSAQELAAPDFEAAWREDLARVGLQPSHLVLEVTEEVLLAELAPGQTQCLVQMHKEGAELWVDDFGTGTSGLSQLLSLPFDGLKIDRLFVLRMEQDDKAHAIVKATISLAHSLGMRVLAEGVETDRQLDYLRALGCDQVQGFGVGRPMSIDQIGLWSERLSTRPRA